MAAEPLVVGTDHVIVAVEDLEAAAATWRALGFALKPGRPHDNGIRNWHAKFPDGTEIELLTAPEARDPLTTTYRRHLESGGDGPAFAGLFAPDRPALLARLRAAGTQPREGGLVTFPDGPLRPLFFGRRNRSPTDLPEHFAHPNGATALAGIWLAPDDPARVEAVLEELGAQIAEEDFHPLGEGVKATVLRLPEGFVALFDDRELRQRPDRPVVGATVLVRDLEAAMRAIGPSSLGRRLSGPGRESLVLPPARTHGLFLELREESPRGRTPRPGPPRAAGDGRAAGATSESPPPIDVAAEVGARTGCFLAREIGSGRVVFEHGGDRCRTPQPACSTLKIPLAAVAFRHGLFTSPDTRIPWDGRPQRREELEQDLTPRSYLELSASWASVWIVERLGAETVTSTLRELLPATPPLTVSSPSEGGAVESGVELTPRQQVDFWIRLWTGELPLPPEAADRLRASVPIDRAGELTVSGKTGSCCIDPGCEDGPGRQLGWFVGVAETRGAAYAFALQLTDLEPTTGYAGAAAREIALRLLPRALAGTGDRGASC